MNELYHVCIQDSIPVRTVKVSLDFLQRKVELMAHSRYSPNLAPSDYFLYPMLKRSLKGHILQSVEKVETAVQNIDN